MTGSPLFEPDFTTPIILSLVPGVLSLLCIASAVLVLRRRRRAAEDEAVCGGCGYSVRGLRSLICPECGADLRTVGIVPASTTGGRWLTTLAIALGLGAMIAAMLGFLLIVPLVVASLVGG